MSLKITWGRVVIEDPLAAAGARKVSHAAVAGRAAELRTPRLLRHGGLQPGARRVTARPGLSCVGHSPIDRALRAGQIFSWLPKSHLRSVLAAAPCLWPPGRGPRRARDGGLRRRAEAAHHREDLPYPALAVQARSRARPDGALRRGGAPDTHARDGLTPRPPNVGRCREPQPCGARSAALILSPLKALWPSLGCSVGILTLGRSPNHGACWNVMGTIPVGFRRTQQEVPLLVPCNLEGIRFLLLVD